jgi:hypothetical protein
MLDVSNRDIGYVRVLRRGETATHGAPSSLSIEERMLLVWDLTEQCLAWQTTDGDVGEPRLQRSLCRVQRRRR